MNQEQTETSNKIIAEFMGFSLSTLKDSFHSEYWTLPEEYRKFLTCSHWHELLFDNNWSWLMPVVEKIGKTMIPKEFTKDCWDSDVHYSIGKVATIFTIGDNSLFITDSGISDGHPSPAVWKNIYESPLTRTYLAVVKFINWYNQCNNGK